MNDSLVQNPPSKLVPVLVGGAVMAATAVIPFLNFINCACCAGIMGGAVLAAYMYKRNFPPEQPFRVSDGVTVGALSGIVGAVLAGVIAVLSMGMTSGSFMQEFETQFETMQQSPPPGSDPAQLEQARQFFSQFADSPGIVIMFIMVAIFVIFVGFGALGGVIGGNIFKTKIVQAPPPASMPG